MKCIKFKKIFLFLDCLTYILGHKVSIKLKINAKNKKIYVELLYKKERV